MSIPSVLQSPEAFEKYQQFQAEAIGTYESVIANLRAKIDDLKSEPSVLVGQLKGKQNTSVAQLTTWKHTSSSSNISAWSVCVMWAFYPYYRSNGKKDH